MMRPGVMVTSGQRRGGMLSPMLLLMLVLHTHSAWAQKPGEAQGFDAFKMVRLRNIFDPDRRPPASQGGSGTVAPIAHSDYVALTGTLVTKDKALAFFSGSRADFDRVLPANEKIAGATITRITPGNVTIEVAGKSSTVAVGWTIPLNGAPSAPAPETAPLLAAAGAVAAAPVAGANPVAGSAAPAASPSPAGPNADVARMMRERRQQENP